MPKTGKCPLCAGELKYNRNVTIWPGGAGRLQYPLAWVCVDCSVAYPIAIGSGGIVRKPRPLYEDGECFK